MEKSAGQARIFDSNERTTLSKATIRPGSAGWHGIAAHQSHIRTCDLEIPRGHATVKCGTSTHTVSTYLTDDIRQVFRSSLLSQCRNR